MDVQSRRRGFWEENTLQPMKYESSNSNDEQPRVKDEGSLYSCCDGNLNFATAPCSEDDSEYGGLAYKKSKVSRQDPMSHRIIEKRRRDRMNNCLADLSRLIPAEYLKKGRGRIEKTEIIEMAIKYMKHLQLYSSPSEHYRLGYQECMSEVMRFLVEVEGHFPRDAICVRLLSHLQKHCDAVSHPPSSPMKDHHPPDPYNDVLMQMPAKVPPITVSPPVINIQIEPPSEVDVIQMETEPNNNNNSPTESDDCVSLGNIYEKHSDSNEFISYKYKNDMKLRFTQDSEAKRTKFDVSSSNGNMRRNSTASIENRSSSRSSPQSNGEMCTRVSSDSSNHIIIPARSPHLLQTYHLKGEEDHRIPHHSSSPSSNNNNRSMNGRLLDVKANFNVPIFVLHAKGSYYVPVTIDYLTLAPFLQNYNLLETFHPNNENVVLHPVTINVNFQPTEIKYKSGFSTWS